MRKLDEVELHGHAVGTGDSGEKKLWGVCRLPTYLLETSVKVRSTLLRRVARERFLVMTYVNQSVITPEVENHSRDYNEVCRPKGELPLRVAAPPSPQHMTARGGVWLSLSSA